MNTSNSKHPKGLSVLFATEMWERFNFYGMRAILVLFLVYALGFSKSESTEFYGGFLGLSYLFNLLGGYVADNILGNRKTIIYGGFIMGIGQLLLYISAGSFDTTPLLSNYAFWSGIALIIFGVGFFKPNISSIVGFLYKDGDSRIDSAFTIFYMGINLGAFIGMNVCAYLGDVVVDGVRNIYAFKWGFLSASIAMFLGTFIFMYYKDKYLRDPDGNPIGVVPNAKKESLQKGKTSFSLFSLLKDKRFYITIVAYVLFFFIFLYVADVNEIYAFIYTTGICLAIYIITDKELTKEEIHRTLVIYIIAFFVMFFWACFEQAGSSLTFFADNQTDRRFLGINIPAGAVQNANSLFIIIFSIPLAFFWSFLKKKKLDLHSVRKQSLGLLLLGLGFFLVAWKVKDISISTKISVLWLFGLYFLHTIGELCLSPVGLSLVSKLAPLKYKSLLMGVWFFSSAAGYSLSGTLGAVLPPTSEQYIKAENAGINLKKVLNKTISLNDEQLEKLQELKIPTQYPKLLGFEIQDLYDFFMLFFFFSLFSSILLFLLSGKLKKWMHGIG